MIKVVAKSVLKEGKLEAYKILAAELAAETRKEKGCITYELFQDVNDSKILTFFEEWESQKALDSHMKSEHFHRIVPQLGQYREDGGSTINVYTLVL